MRRALHLGLEIGFPLLLLAGYGAWAAGAESFYFPALGDIAASFAELTLSEQMVDDVVPSLRRLGLGYLLSVVLGVAGGLVLGSFKLVQEAFQPIVQFLRALPSPVLIPFAIILLGIGDTMKVFLIVLGAVWPILLNTTDGVRSVDRAMIDMARAYNVGPWARTWRIVVPAALPRVLAGMRTSIAIAIVLMVISEMYTSRDGLGMFVLQAQRTFSISDMWAGILLLGIIGYVGNFVFVRSERSLLHWHRGAKGHAR
ncbi:ABC transporter permease [Egibacter rhizosphaerae]|uniref:ABC transporter permease n=1 Tax=Egibacter rhizosphaerae TaxID=1670831 RepID=A0A411YHS5_9ACTN|nr:ABC transporter permease [Egibacter rhizosphaerae]QBI20818.1 ABC transporter permease [Egibacter rhizosphaerae]